MDRWEVVNCAFANGTFNGNDINSNVACAEAIVAVKVPVESPLSVAILALLIILIARRRTV